MPPKPPLIILVGPTAVGKTEIAIQLAETVGGEIVSADSRLFYRGMDIGTAKPNRQERERVPHHLIDIVDPSQTVSLAVFQHMAREAIAEIHGRHHLPVLVGGTGQYIRALTEGWHPPEVEPDSRLRSELARLKEQRGGSWLHDRLRQLDPDSAEKIDARNARRTVRALEVILTTGRPFSTQRLRAESPFEQVTIGLRRFRAELYARIDSRIDAMFEAGLLGEVRRLLDAGYGPDLPAMSAIGYKECVYVIRGEWTNEQAKAHMQRATRVYVRRQANWFKETDPAIHWFDAAAPDITARIAEFIRNAFHEPLNRLPLG
jgi:tRNA dimethylallyltransferase